MNNQEQLDNKLKELIIHESDNNFIKRYLMNTNKIQVRGYVDSSFQLLHY